MPDSEIEAREKLLERTVCEIFIQALRAGRVVRLRVWGSSMLPSVWPRDTIVVHPLTDWEPFVGQLVLYRRDGRLIAHRIVGCECDGASIMRFVTRGDALAGCDEPVTKCQIFGVVNTIVRRGRQLQVSAQQPRGILVSTLRHSDLACRLALKIHGILLRFAR